MHYMLLYRLLEAKQWDQEDLKSGRMLATLLHTLK